MSIKWNKKTFKKVLKRTGMALCTFVLAGTISVGSYNAYLNSKLDDIEISTESIELIKDFYDSSDEEINIFIMNDSQGLNLNLGFWKNSYPEYLKDELCANVVDASSLRFNKVLHIDMLLDNNLSVAEIKKLNNEGNQYALRKFFNENGYSLISGLLSGVSSKVLTQKIEDSDYDVCVSDLLKNSYKPIVIYSSGANDLMFLANATPNSLKKYDEDGNITNKYLYAESVLSNPQTIDFIIDSIEQTFIKILTINPNSKIFVLSIYVPKSFSDEDYKAFVLAINRYNEKLKQLCDNYGLYYVDESSFGDIYNDKDYDFHIDVVGHKQLASMLIDIIATNISTNNSFYFEGYTYDSDGLEGFYSDLLEAINIIRKPSDEEIKQNSYLEKVYLSQLKGRTEDSEICKKLIKEK